LLGVLIPSLAFCVKLLIGLFLKKLSFGIILPLISNKGNFVIGPNFCVTGKQQGFGLPCKSLPVNGPFLFRFGTFLSTGGKKEVI